jgi:phage terminase large subunit
MQINLVEYLDKTVAPKFRPVLQNDNRYSIVYGGAGSGKSWIAAKKQLLRICKEPGHKLLVCRKVARSIRPSVYTLIVSQITEWGLLPLAQINKSDMTIKIAGSEIIMLGLDDVDKLKSVEGVTSIWIEEADQITSDDFDQLDLRLRGMRTHYKQIMMTFNPISVEHWIKKRFFDEKVPDTWTHHSTYLDNPFIDEEYKNVFERLKISNWNYYNIYALGNWGVYEGLVFDDWRQCERLPEDYDKRFIGVDYGYNVPSAVVEVRQKGNALYWDEIIYEAGLTNPDLIERMKAEKIKGTIYADSAEPDRIEEMNRAGMNVYKAHKANRIDRIDFVKAFNIHITKRSVNLMRELGTYVWDKDRDGNALDEPIKFNDHAIDAACYAAYTGLRKPIFTEATITGLY